ncbi:MAG TPA: 2-amino-4-hydroxy-6-hydroxymethyldihydropteridine diphosphokinase [Chthoniobacteraceae bacterium]|nr:2-amino-4-hydroxy-6-hydroxymethyldihydropteridine diphosphokinase [Chthoniobacteraceae bacterium]
MRTGIALGSNLGDRLGNLRAAFDRLKILHNVSGPVLASRLYETEPVHGEPDAAPYLNAVIEVEYHGELLALLSDLQAIEAELGRPSKRPRNASRTIDLDLLYAGNLVLRNDEVVIPHPRLHQRAFVLTPLADIRPELILPGHECTIAQLLASLRDPAAVALFSDTWEA